MSIGRLSLAGLTLVVGTAWSAGQDLQRFERVQTPPKKSGFSAFTESVSTGMKKFSDAVTPKTPILPAPDGASLANPSKPGPELYLAVARSYEVGGRPHDAEAQFKRLFQSWPNHLEGLLAYAQFLDRQNRAGEAIAAYQHAAKKHPKDPAVPNALGLCYAEHNMFAEATAALRMAITLAPKQAVFRNNLAMVLVEMGRTEEAYAQLRTIQDEATAYYNLGYLLQKRGQKNEAAGCFTAALKHNPSFGEAQVWLEHLQTELAAAPAPKLVDRRAAAPAAQPRLTWPGKPSLDPPPSPDAASSATDRPPMPEGGPSVGPALVAPHPDATAAFAPSRPAQRPITVAESRVARLPPPPALSVGPAMPAESSPPIPSRESRPDLARVPWLPSAPPRVAPLPSGVGPNGPTTPHGTRNTQVVYPLPPVDNAPIRRY